MSTIHDTTNLKPYRPRTLPIIGDGFEPFVMQELQNVSASLAQCIVALKAIEARIVAGGL
jgi:hypothetical protein